MIKVELGVREALTMISNGCSLDMFEKIVASLEVALGINQNRNVTITKMPRDNRIPCIKAIRLHSGWGLKEAKEFTDVLVGRYDGTYGKWIGGSNDNTMKLPTNTAAEALLRDLTNLGCEGFLS